MTCLEVSKLSDVFIGIGASAESSKAEALEVASVVTRVDSEQTQALAIDALKLLQDLSRMTETSRVTVKAPVLDLTRKIDGLAKEFVADVDREALRIKFLISKYQEAIQKAARAAEAARVAEAQRLEQERLKALQDARRAETEEARKSAFAKAEEAKSAKQATLALPVVQAPLVEGMRAIPKFVFEVRNIAEVYAARPDFVELSIKRATVNSWLSGGGRECPGLTIREEMQVRV